MMKKITLLIVCICFALVSLNAQNKGGKERVKAMKVAHITEKLQLSSDEAQKFWPVYNAYEENTSKYRTMKFTEIKKKLRGQNIDAMSEAEAKKILAQTEDVAQKMYTERRKLIKNLQKILSAKKILLLKKAEDDFNKNLLRQLRERRERHFNKN